MTMIEKDNRGQTAFYCKNHNDSYIYSTFRNQHPALFDSGIIRNRIIRMQENLEIRKYRKEDHEAVIELLRLNTPAFFSASEEAGLHDFLHNHSENYYVIESMGGILGAGGFILSQDLSRGTICWDLVHPAHHGKGIGRKLTEFRIRQMQEAGSPKTIIVRTAQFTYGFYEKMGFALREIVKDYWANGYDLYWMEYVGTPHREAPSVKY